MHASDWLAENSSENWWKIAHKESVNNTLLLQLSIGFGDRIKWVAYEDGLKEIKNRYKSAL